MSILELTNNELKANKMNTLYNKWTAEMQLRIENCKQDTTEMTALIDCVASEYPDLTDMDFVSASENAAIPCDGMNFLELFAASCGGIEEQNKQEVGE